MANGEHLSILRDEVKTWNQWRERNAEAEYLELSQVRRVNRSVPIL
jgi:hypothetical protein